MYCRVSITRRFGWPTATFLFAPAELEDPSGPQIRMDPTEGAFTPLSHFPIGLLEGHIKWDKKNMGFLGSLGTFLEAENPYAPQT